MPTESPTTGATTTPGTFDAHLERQLTGGARAYTLDMDDGPEQQHLADAGILNEALTFLHENLDAPYDAADKAAGRHQGTHRRLAKTAIFTGTLSVMLAIVQLCFEQTLPTWKVLAQGFEGLAVVAGVIAVMVGLWAKFDHQWFIQRHRAERLRMLKFLALGQTELWDGRMDAWKKWVRDGISDIAKITKIEQVKEWAKGGNAEPLEPAPPSSCAESMQTLEAFSSYYRWKRVEFQAAYFGKQAGKFRNQTRPLAHLGLPLFFLSVLAVVVHFVAEWTGQRLESQHHAASAKVWHVAAAWALALAALLPVLSLGVRAWLGAFEHVRSASLFEAKQRALRAISNQIAKDHGHLGKTMHHTAHVEHFLEHEHREWLRLLLDAEWFV